MVTSIFKNIGKGIGYFFLFPLIIIAVAIYAVFGFVVFLIQFVKLIVLFFTGRTLFSDLPEDVQVKAMITKDPDEEEKKEDDQLSLYPSDSPVYGSAYSSPDFLNEKKDPEIEEEPSPEEGKEDEDNAL